MELIIERKNIPNLLRDLSTDHRIVAPQERNGEILFDDLKNYESMILGYKVTTLPPKQYLFPPEEILFTYSGKRIRTPLPGRKLLLFGLSLRDLEAVTQLDEIMSTPHPDYFYWKRRSRSVIIGLTNEQVSVPPGGDLILEKMDGERYRAIPLPPAGREIVKNRLFKKEDVGQKAVYEENETMKELKKLLLDPELLKDAVRWSWYEGHPIWEELGKRCIGCGICTYVCPICHCFSMENSVSLDCSTCTRCRKWDACTLPGFARIAGRYDHHPTQKKRYHNWHYHKFVRGYREYGKSQCVACGRCQHYCPARIDIEKELLRIVRDYQEARK